MAALPAQQQAATLNAEIEQPQTEPASGSPVQGAAAGQSTHLCSPSACEASIVPDGTHRSLAHSDAGCSAYWCVGPTYVIGQYDWKSFALAPVTLASMQRAPSATATAPPLQPSQRQQASLINSLARKGRAA